MICTNHELKFTAMELSNNVKNILYGAGVMATGLVAKEIATKSWKATKGSNPPEDPSQPDTSTRDVLLWTVGLAIIGGLAKVFYKKWVPNPKNE